MAGLDVKEELRGSGQQQTEADNATQGQSPLTGFNPGSIQIVLDEDMQKTICDVVMDDFEKANVFMGLEADALKRLRTDAATVQSTGRLASNE